MIASWLLCLALGADPLPEAARESRPLGPDVAVVCPPHWSTTLQPWLAHRRLQGHRIHLISNQGSAAEIQARLRALAAASRPAPDDRQPEPNPRPAASDIAAAENPGSAETPAKGASPAAAGGLRFVVLVGDAEPAARLDADLRARSVPTHHVRAKVNVHWGSEPEIASDNPYGDLDGDGLPDVAVGRMSVDSEDELARLVQRILRYEQQAATGQWQRRVSFVAGVGGFGQLADSVLEMATKKFLTEGIPPAYTLSMTYGSWRSPFCPDPRNFHQATLDRLNEGCLFWVYIGHGQRRYLDRVQVPGGAFHIFDTDDVAKVHVAEGAPIAIFLACYTGAFDEPRDCLAEAMLRADNGPVAVLSGSRVTMPYAMAVMGNALMDEHFRNRRATLGEVVLHAKRRLVRTPEGNLEDASQDSVAANRLLLDALARAISPSADLLDEERLEHVALFNLLGDPLLRLPRPETVELQMVEEVVAGGTVELRGSTPHAGRGTVELVCRHDRTRGKSSPRTAFEPTHEALAKYDEVYREANDRKWMAVPVRFAGGPFRLTFDVPDEARGPCYVRVALQGERQLALGTAKVFVRSPPATDVGD